MAKISSKPQIKLKKKTKIVLLLRVISRDLPGSPVTKIPHSQYRGPGFNL